MKKHFNLKVLGICALYAVFVACSAFVFWMDKQTSFILGLLSATPAFVLWAFLSVPRDNQKADDAYWTIDKEYLDRLMPEYEKRMIARGYARENYIPNVHDCDDYEPAGRSELHDMLMERRGKEAPVGKADPLFAVTFRRDDGKRHRLFEVETNQGLVCIENYRINGSMYRTLSKKERKNARRL